MNHICVLCLTDAIETWLDNRKMSLVKPFKDYSKVYIDNVGRRQRMTCTVCRTESYNNICKGCFSKSVYTWLAKKDKTVADEFALEFAGQSSAKKQLYA